MSVVYGLALFDRLAARIESNERLPVEGVEAGSLIEFLQVAGKIGWELCAAYPVGIVGNHRAVPGKPDLWECKDPGEEVAFIFKRVN